MANVVKHLLSTPSLMAFRILRFFKNNGPGFRVLLFHDTPRDQFEKFKTFITYVKKTHGIISPKQAQAWLGGSPPPTKSTPCLFSFDDGFASNYHLAEEVLAQHEVQALFFACPGLMDLDANHQGEIINANIYQGRKKTSELLMTWQQTMALKDKGHTIGAHGLTHQRLSHMTGESLRREVIESGTLLEQRLGCAIDWYAFAFGDDGSISEEALKIISEKFSYCRSGIRGANSTSTHHHAIRADHVDMTAPTSYRKLTLEGGLDFRYAKARAFLDKISPSTV